MSKRSLLLVFAVALSARLVFLYEVSGTALFDVLLGDAARFDAWAREIAGGDWIGGEVFYQAPLYPYFVGVVYLIAGPHLFAVRVAQAVLGAVGCTLVAASGARLFGRRVGFLAGAITALYAPAIWLDGLIQKTSLALFLSALLLYVVARHATGPRTRWSFLAGAALGLLVLVRENAFVLLLPFGAWFLWGIPAGATHADRRSTIAPFVLAFLCVLAPVALRNAVLGGALLPTASNFGVNFYLGNNAHADGLYTPLVEGRGHPEFEAEDARRLAERELGSDLTPGRVSAFWLARGVEDVRADPVRWLRLLGRKAFLVVNHVEIMDAEAFEAHADTSRLLGALRWVTRFGVLLPLAVLGVLTRWSRRRRLWPFWTAAAALGASIVLFFVVARFRIGMVPFLAPFAAAGALDLLERARSPRRILELRLALPVAIGVAVLAGWPPGLPGDPRSTTWSNVASAYLRRGDAESALRYAEEALREDPANAAALFNLGVAQNALGRTEDAVASIRAAMERSPSFVADGTALLGSIAAGNGELPAAIAFFERSLMEDSTNADVHYSLALALRRTDRLDEAEAHYLEAIRLRPDFTDAHHNLGFLCELTGRFAEAAGHYRDALRIDPGFALSREALARLRAEHPEALAGDREDT